MILLGKTVRLTALVLGVGLGVAGIWSLVSPAVRGLPTTSVRDFPDLLTGVAAIALLAVGTWFGFITLAIAIEAVSGRRSRLPGCPQVWRRALLGMCGAAVVIGAAGPTYAATQAPPGPEGLEGLSLPSRPTGSLVVPVTHLVRADAAVVVRTGDSLWRIAERQLPTDAGPTEIDAQWRRLHDLNRDVVGDDPDLIQPGQRLVLPEVPDTNRFDSEDPS